MKEITLKLFIITMMCVCYCNALHARAGRTGAQILNLGGGRQFFLQLDLASTPGGGPYNNRLTTFSFSFGF